MTRPEPHGVRVGTEEREAAVRELGEHFSEGRLNPDEYEERMSAAYAARFAADLDALFTDLPRARSAVVPAPARMPEPTPDAPHGRDPVTGEAYSDRHKVVAGVLQLVLPFGVGRFYSGHVGTGIAQLLLSFIGIGVVWAFIDGIVMLVGRPRDPRGRLLRP